MFCPNCGKSVEDANYCKYCGTKLDINSMQEFGEEESFEQQKARLMKNRIPHCPKCLSTHITAIHLCSSSQFYETRFVCLWCQYEWRSEGKEKHKKKGLGKTK